MIPVRVQVEGFMSYRDRAELQFCGSPLWMLSGPNGAGKSTIFDAITFVLYGLHRGGKQDARELINHNSDALVVEFDFSIGTHAYRVRRTLSKRNRSSFQAFSLAPDGIAKAIAETETKSGFDAWITDTLGLDDRTFTASVLLQQGKSDALLEANPAHRHAMLSQIVDLSEYEKLHHKTETRRKEFETEARVLDSQLQGIEVVDETEIERLGQEAEAARAQVAAAQQQLQALAALKVLCARWHELQQKRTEIEAALAGAQELFAQETSIRRDAARLNELLQILPHLQKVQALREQSEASAQRLAELEVLSTRLAAELEAAQEALRAIKTEIATLQGEQRDWQKRLEEATQERHEYTTAIHELNSLDTSRAELATLDAALTQFAADLDAQLEQASAQEAELAEVKSALPWLRQFMGARDEWCARKEAASEAKTRIAALETQLQTLRETHRTAETAEQKYSLHAQEAHKAETQARTRLGEAEKQLARFKEVGGQPQCSYCGQPLTPEHRERELRKLNEHMASLQSEVAATAANAQAAGEQFQQATQHAQQLAVELRQCESDYQQWKSELKAAHNAGHQAQAQAQAALDNLPHEFKRHIQPAEEKLTDCFKATFPTTDDLNALQTRAQTHTKAVRQVETLREAQQERERKRAARESVANRAIALETKYPEARAREIRGAYAATETNIKAARAQLQTLDNQMQTLETQRTAHETAVEKARADYNTTGTSREAEAAKHQQTEQWRVELEAQTPDAWRDVTQTLTPGVLAALQDESRNLNGAAERLRDLEAARSSHQSWLHRREEIADELQNVPPSAQRPLVEIEAERTAQEEQQQKFSTLAEEMKSEQQALQAQRAQRADLEARFNEAERQAQQHKILADLLGRDKLQRYLLQQAEEVIVANANHVLDRISGGNLRLELKREDDGKTGRAAGAKALDLLAINEESGGQPMPVYLLSGSQRFRVAVSLALGIGRFASGEHHSTRPDGSPASTAGAHGRRIESVIIDEGFGSLDQEGRREIIDELHNLKSVLDRVILVSHQEEFAAAFPNRYLIELKNGTSTARVVEGNN